MITTKLAKIAIFAPLAAGVFGALGAIGSGAVATADPLAYGPNTCIDGYVWREASQYDETCVLPQTRTDTATENNLAIQNREPGGGAYGPDTCRQGFVWREAFANDRVCVTPDVRAQAAADNAAAPARLVANQSAGGPVPHPAGPFYPGGKVVPASPGTAIGDVFGGVATAPAHPGGQIDPGPNAIPAPEVDLGKLGDIFGGLGG